MTSQIEQSAPEISPLDAHALVRAGDGVVVDVRESWEWSAGHASGATHLPLNTLGARHGELPRERAALLICASGNRSLTAARYLTSLGYDARSIAGGTSAWGAQRLPLETGAKTVS